jgi:hypothetical protein
MKMTIAKTDLEAALGITAYSLGTDSASDWTKNYFLRHTDNGMDIHTTNHRYCSSTALNTCTVDDGGSFNLPANRIKELFSHMENTVVTLTVKDDIVILPTSRGDLRFPCSKQDFPYWDKSLAEAKTMMTIKAESLMSVINHHKKFVSDPDDKTSMYRYISFQNGGILSGDGLNMCLTVDDMFDDADFYLTKLDVNPLLGFLKSCAGDVVIEHCPKMVYFKSSSDAVFGMVKPPKRVTAGLSGINVKQMSTSITNVLAEWSTSKANIVNTLGMINFTMDDADKIVKFQFENGSLFCIGRSLAGGVDTLEIGLDSFKDDTKVLENASYFDRTVFTKVLKLMDDGAITVKILKSLNNSPVIEHDVGGFTTYSLVVPVQTANF